MRLGKESTTDFPLQVDAVSSVPLRMGRTSRLASVAQRIAMFAVQGACSWIGCTTGAITRTGMAPLTKSSWILTRKQAGQGFVGALVTR